MKYNDATILKRLVNAALAGVIILSTGAFDNLGAEVNNKKTPEMVIVEGGTLTAVSGLGELEVDTFRIGRYEVTWGVWVPVRDWAGENGYDIGNAGEGDAHEHPVHSVNWYEAVKWSNAKSEKRGLIPAYEVEGSIYRTGEFGPENAHKVDWNRAADGYRLPAEAEWEFAARGGIKSRGYIYSGSDDIDEVAWYNRNSGGAPSNMVSGSRGVWPVGKKAGNELGLHDMSGNVWEWCWDPVIDHRRIRGGCWNSDRLHYCAVSSRYGISPSDGGIRFGFRLARNQ